MNLLAHLVLSRFMIFPLLFMILRVHTKAIVRNATSTTSRPTVAPSEPAMVEHVVLVVLVDGIVDGIVEDIMDDVVDSVVDGIVLHSHV